MWVDIFQQVALLSFPFAFIYIHTHTLISFLRCSYSCFYTKDSMRLLSISGEYSSSLAPQNNKYYGNPWKLFDCYGAYYAIWDVSGALKTHLCMYPLLKNQNAGGKHKQVLIWRSKLTWNLRGEEAAAEGLWSRYFFQPHSLLRSCSCWSKKRIFLAITMTLTGGWFRECKNSGYRTSTSIS